MEKFSRNVFDRYVLCVIVVVVKLDRQNRKKLANLLNKISVCGFSFAASSHAGDDR